MEHDAGSDTAIEYMGNQAVCYFSFVLVFLKDIFTEAEIQQWDRDSRDLWFINERRVTKLHQWEAYRRAQRLRWDIEKVAKKVVKYAVLKALG